MIRTFKLYRREDESHVSGTGWVAEGVQFSNGLAALNWLTDKQSFGLYPNMETLIAIHGHKGKTVVVWDGGKNEEDANSVSGSGDGDDPSEAL